MSKNKWQQHRSLPLYLRCWNLIDKLLFIVFNLDLFVLRRSIREVVEGSGSDSSRDEEAFCWVAFENISLELFLS